MTGNSWHPSGPAPAVTPSVLADAVLAQARRTPGARAVEDGDVALDYAALDRASRQVAHALRAAGVSAGDAVAVRLPRSWRLVCTLLGIRRLGATVVPLDRLSPPDRQRHVLDDSGAVAVVLDGSAEPVEAAPGTATLAVDRLLGEPEATTAAPDDAAPDDAAPDTPCLDALAPDVLAPDVPAPDVPAPHATGRPAPAAFVFYTSGTTGRPKGVEVTDDGVLRLARPGYLDARPGDRYACLSNPAFDALSFEVWTPLLTGGTCVVLDDTRVSSPLLLAAALRDRGVRTLFVTTALFNAVVDEVPDCFGAAGQVLVGGEQLDARRIRRWYAANPGSAAVLHNVYGPTEATTFALSHAVPRDFDGEVVPIGTPLPGTGVLLRTEDGRAAEPGEVAELLLSGAALALGYRNLPEETAQRFVRLPAPAGEERRWYRTGDLVRQDGEGLVTYVGRADRQVKVRGFRIEPGEVERRILAHPGVRQVHVCTRRDQAGGNELLAFVAPAGDLAFEAYDRHLAAVLPPYMRPHRTHLVDALPLNANGKVDQDGLLRTAGTPWRAAHRDTAPATPAQQRVLDLAEQVLGVTGLRPDDRWIPNGGDSLKALRFRFGILRRFTVDVPQELVLRADFAAVADAVHASDATAGDLPPVTAAGERTAAATGEQERLWLLHQRDPLDGAYDVPVVFELHGIPDPAALRHALRTLVERHPALRTRLVPTAHGLLQQVDEPYDPWEPAGTASAATAPGTDSEETWERAAERFFAHRFDLTGSRMLRAAWLPSGDGGHLLLHLHHIAVDGWSLTLLFRDLSDAYASRAAHPDRAALSDRAARADAGRQAAAATPLDFARWQRAWHSTPAYAARRTRLRTHYASHPGLSPALEQPSGTPGPPRAGLLHTSLDIWHRAALDRIAADSGLTRFEVLLPAFAWALYGVTGQTRPLIAAPVSGRPRPELADSVGMFANTVLVPLRLEAHGTLAGQLAAQGASVREVLAGQDVALADVLADHTFRDQGPLFDFLFVLENTDFTGLRLPGCRTRPVWPRPLGAKCALTVSLVEHEDGFDCLWEYRDDIGADRARAAARLFREALDTLAHGGRGTLRELITPYRRGLPGAGRGPAPEPGFTTIAEGFARQVAHTPGAVAVAGRDRSHSYAELDALAEALARDLATRHPLPDDPVAPASVALYLPPSVDHVAALLAAARLNLTVVPLDPAYPPALLRQILEQAGPVCVLVTAGRAAELDALAPPGLPRHVIASGPPAAVPAAPATAAAATGGHQGLRPLYTLFTSGSTGTPKGVQVSDRTLCNLLTWQAGPGGLGRPAVTQQFSMLSFDVSFQEIFTTLCAGATLRLVEPAWRQDVPTLLDELETGGAERIFLPYVALQLLAEHGVRTGRYPSRLREVVTAGEQLVCTDAVRRWFAGLPGARLFNHYGPTETHVVSALCLEGDPAAWPLRPAIGRPVAGAVLRVVDETGVPVPPGATGQLLIGGLMAGRCYLDDPALNRDRFTDDPELGTFYRSGDLARFDTDGLLHYAGRDDGQIKLSGHRLELGQVETALLSFPGVTAATVLAVGGSLVACLRCEGADPDPADLNRHLGGLLPAHVRVARFRRLTSLPRTPSGKLDRRAALTAPGHDLAPRAAADRALSELEGRLTALFEQAAGRTAGPDQRFFDTGATSLDLMRFHLRCAGEGDLPFSVPELFEHVTIRALAALVAARRTPLPPGGHPPERQRTREPGRDLAAEPVAAQPAPAQPAAVEPIAVEPIAVVGMAVRLPGAPDLAAFWDLVTSGRRGIEHFPATGGRVGARSQLSGPLGFDPARFGISPAEARLMDPQQRQLLMTCVEALAHAGLAEPGAHRVGLVAACGENTYFQSMLREADPAALPDTFRLALHHEKDFLATKAAYHLGLTGPAFTVQSACSSSLVGVHVAAGLLRQGDAGTMLVGGVLVDPELTDGYTYRPQHIFSPDGRCRPFSADAEGTVGASGTGVVVLKPLAAARRDGDTVYAVITGSAINNDGSAKLGYSAPSLTGQRDAIRTALARSGRSAADLGYVEAHGTGTRLGDPVEAAALRQAYGLGDDAGLALSSVKSQLGHLGAAAGVVGLVRAVLAVHHGVVPPTADFGRLNPEIGDGPFRIPTAAEPWPLAGPRVAAVSSFGIGGTNAHLLLEAPYGTDVPVTGPDPEPEPERRLVLSAHSRTALRADARRIADYLAAHPAAYQQVLHHLRTGRPVLAHRAEAVCPDARSAVAWLRTAGTVPTGEAVRAETPGTVPAGHTLAPPRGPAPAPWDFPPPAFDIADHDFPRGTAPAAGGEAVPARLPAARWLHQPLWTRLRRARTGTSSEPRRTVVAVVAADADPAAWRAALEPSYRRVVVVQAGASCGGDGDRHRRADPADPGHLTALFAELAAEASARAADGVDWLHALPLAVDGEIGERAMETARWACLDTVAALCTALADTPAARRPRVWLLSHQAQPVTGPVARPEPGLLAAAVRIPRQELGLTLCWADLPGPDPADWAPYLPDLPDHDGDDPLTPAMSALRDGYWWQRVVQPVAHAPAEPPRHPAGGTHLVLGGTGGIGTALAARLLRQDGDRVVLVARRTGPPPALAPYADRVTTVQADLAEEDLDAIRERLAPHLDRLVSVVHAVGTPGGGLLARRDPVRARRDTAAKLRGALLLERLIAEHAPDHAVYCSSMAALFGGTGQFDYAAASGCLDAFAAYAPDGTGPATVRTSIGWDAWREVGMAQHALSGDTRHQAHLSVALTPEDGAAVFERALHLQLPHLMVSTTALAEAPRFYAAERPVAPLTADPRPAHDAGRRGEHRGDHGDHDRPGRPAPEGLAGLVCDLLGVDAVDPDTSLYDLGADSLTLLDLVVEVQRRYGTEIDLSRLSHRVSLTELAGHLDDGGDDAPPVPAREDTGPSVGTEVWQHGDGPDVLCLVHPVGGDIQAYRPLAAALPPGLTVCLIPDPALRDPERPTGSIDERAERYLAALRARFPQPDRRISLAGWSFGAWTALSMAAAAERAGGPAHALYLLDPPPPGAGPRLGDYDDRQIDAVFARELSGDDDGRLTERGRRYAERLARCCRANLAAMAAHRLPRLTGTPATLWLAGRPVPDTSLLAPGPAADGDWHLHLPPPVRTHHVDADHYGLMTEPHVRTVAAVIEKDLTGRPPAAAAQEDPRPLPATEHMTERLTEH